jgi:hypothetical protein
LVLIFGEKYEKNARFYSEIKNKFMTLSDRIGNACDGLIYISETDAPVVPFAGGPVADLTPEAIIQHTDHGKEKPTEEISFDIFFSKLTKRRDWFGEAEIGRAKRFGELQKLLEENLRDLKVFRIGEIQIDIYAVGLDGDGNLAGVTTKAVET